MADWNPKANDIFVRAAEIDPPNDRRLFLEQQCGDDAGLRARVESLLAAGGQIGSFLEQPAAPALAANGATAAYPPVTEGPGTVIGPYKLMEQIGEGGMGLVFVAEQQEPVRRKVALKVIKPGMDTREVIARFEAERQALALMDHPNIARVLDAGATDSGRPYFVMELVKGVPITDYCDQSQLTPRERLELFVSVCRAVQHAHTKGVIHRDLKPSNILIAPHDGKPVVKVIDFGVAKATGGRLTDKTVYTRLTQMIGTPLYMSPEQAEINALDVDTRSDVYSLGVLLYELLTGTTPFDSERLKRAAFDELRRIIREEEPPRPSTRLTTLGATLSAVSARRKTEPGKLPALVRGDLDWIVMKTLEKDRTRRYETANGLARDVERYLKDEPVEACPPTAGYRLRKFARKNRKVLTTAAAFAVLLLLGVAASAWQAVRATQAEAEANANAVQAREKEQEANQQRDDAQRRRDEVQALNDKLRVTQAELRRALYVSNVNLARHAWDAGGVEQVRELLDPHRPKMGEADLRGFEWHYLNRLCRAEISTADGFSQPWSMALSPDGKLLAIADMTPSKERNVVNVVDVQAGKVLLKLKGLDSADSLAFSPDGKRLAGSYGDVKVWDVQTGKDLLSIKGGGSRVAFSPDGKSLATTHVDKRVKVWDAQTGQELLAIEGAFNCVAFSPDGHGLAAASDDNTVKLWDAKTGKELRALKGHTATVLTVAFSPDGKRLASAGWKSGPSESMAVKVWDTKTGQELFSIPGGGIRVAFSPDSKLLACGGARDSDNTIQVRDAQSGRELFTLKGNTVGVHTLAFSADGKRLAAAGYGAVRVWDVRIANNPLILQGGKTPVAFSPDGKRLASAGGTVGELKVWDALTGQEQRTLKVHDTRVAGLAFHPDGKRLATTNGAAGPGQREVKVWDVQTGEKILAIDTLALGVAFSPDGKTLVGTLGGGVRVWDANTGKELRFLSPTGGGGGRGGRGGFAAFSPDGKRLAYTPGRGRTTVWDVETGRELLAFDKGVVVSPDGKMGAEGGADGTVKLWDAQTGERVLTLKGHTHDITKVAFSPDGKRLASTDYGGTVKVWDAETGQELLSLKGGGSDVAFSPDGRRLATDSREGGVAIWDATPLPEKP